MDALKSLSPKIPEFVNYSFYVSPGIVSTVFKVIWAVVTFVIVQILITSGFAVMGTTSLKSTISSVSSGSWGGMISNCKSFQAMAGLLFWLVLLATEILFALSIENATIRQYKGNECSGAFENFTMMGSSMWDFLAVDAPYPSNFTQLKQLLNKQNVGNLAMLGDGKFAVADPTSIFAKDQRINVTRAGFRCRVYGTLASGSGLSTAYISKPFNVTFPGGTQFLYDNSYIGDQRVQYYMVNILYASLLITNDPEEKVFVFIILNPSYVSQLHRSDDINVLLYNSSMFVNTRMMLHEYGHVTIKEEGHLNSSSINQDYVFDKDLSNTTVNKMRYGTGTTTSHAFFNCRPAMTGIDFSDNFVNSRYNKTINETIARMNDMVSAYLLNNIDPNIDMCTVNGNSVSTYIYVTGTMMSFGYAIVGIVFAAAVLLFTFIYERIFYGKTERSELSTYTELWHLLAIIKLNQHMTEKEFKAQAKRIALKGTHQSDDGSNEDSAHNSFIE